MKSHSQKRLWRTVVTQGIILLALLAFVFPGTFLRGEMISPADMLFRIPPWSSYAPQGWSDAHNKLMSDVLTAFQPYYILTKEALRQGEWPLWNPLEFTGMPLLANCQTAVFYPPRLLHAAMDVHVATTLYIILKLWLCGMTALLCGIGIGLSVPAARFFSVGWMLASYNLIWCNWSLPDVSAWLPVVFLGVEWILNGRYRRGGATLALGATLILLAGHPETAFAMGMGVGLYFLARLVWERRWGRTLWLPILVCGAAWTVALLVCAGQLLPFVEYLHQSATFADRHIERNQHRLPPDWLPPGNIVSFWLPRFFGTTKDVNFWGKINSNLYSMIYPGIAVWLLLVLLPVRVRPRPCTTVPRRSLFSLVGVAPRSVCLAFTALVFILAAFQAPPLDKFYKLPLIGSMLQCYHVVFATFALPLLGAIGLDRWLSRPRKLRELGWSIPMVLAMSASIWWLYTFSASLVRALRMNAYIDHQIAIAAALTVVVLVLLAVQCFRPKPRLIAGLLTLVLACDLIYANRGLNPTIERKYLVPDMQLTRFLRELGPATRFGMGEGDIPCGLMVSYGLEDWLGYDGLYPARIIRFHERLKDDIWGNIEPVRAIQYFLNDPQFESIIPPENMKRLERIAVRDGIEIYRNPSAFPRAFLVNELQVIPDVGALFDTMRRPDFDPKRLAVTEVRPSGTLPHATAENLGGATIDQHLSTRVRVTADAKQDCVLVLADAYYPGWKAMVDGRPAELFPVYYNFRGLLLPAGRHTVEYIYAPWTFRVGMAIATVTLLTTILACLIWLIRTKDEGRLSLSH